MGKVLVNETENPVVTLLLAHGAGAGMDTQFMNCLAEGLVQYDIRVCRFEFPYMVKRRITGKKSPPNRMPILLEAFSEQINSFKMQNRLEPLFIGGKSMGGRVATMLIESSDILGSIAYGYPFHPPGKPDSLRIEHLQGLSKPLLVVQGSRDPFGKREENPEQWLPSTAQLKWLEDGDHSFKPRKSSGRTLVQNLNEAIDQTVTFIDAVLKTG